VKEVAAEGIPVAVTCRVLQLARQPYYRWLADPVTTGELTEALRANALSDAHHDDPEFGYRFLADEAHEAGESMSERTAWRICSNNRWWSAFGKPRRGKNGKPGPPVHDDLVQRNFRSDAPNQLWLSGITEHRTSEGKLYLCAVKDVFSNRIIGYSIDSRTKSRLAVTAVNSAVARRGDVSGCVIHTDRGSQFPRADSSTRSTVIAWSDRWAVSARSATTPPWKVSSACFNATSWTDSDGRPASSSGSRSSPGSNAPTTGGGDRPGSAD